MAPMLASPVDVNHLITTPTSLPLRVAVFVRRIDPGIRIAPGSTLIDSILNKYVVPVAVDSNGLSTLNGVGNYSTFFYPTVSMAYRRFGATSGPFTVLQFGPATPPQAFAAVRQVGQQLVDNDGIIYTVVALPDEGAAYYGSTGALNTVVVSPGLPFEYLLSPADGQTQSPLVPGRTIEMLCTPQIPASVQIVELRP
jgi:hypothetical protein